MLGRAYATELFATKVWQLPPGGKFDPIDPRRTIQGDF